MKTEQVRTTSHRFLIVGGRGRIGRLFERELIKQGQNVDIYDVDDPRDLASTVTQAEFVLIAVPMAQSTEIARRVAPWVGTNALLADLNSLKSEICQAMESSTAGEVVGLHPMFGPSLPHLRRQKMVVCPVRTGEKTKFLMHLFDRMGLELVHADPETHDRMMAMVQVLVHFSTLVLGSALHRSGTSIEQSLEFTSPIYRMELALIGRLFAQDPNLYAEIEMANPYGDEIRQHFIEAAVNFNDLIQRQDRQEFCDHFREIRSYLAEFSDQSMELSNFLIDCMTSKSIHD